MNPNQLLNDTISYVKNFSQLTSGEQLAWAAIVIGVLMVLISLIVL
ncbi:MAG TPA: hypothetical protein VJB66_02260 [Candidatus Nanoarchaeia archaeon]|nr:hypothetical protein [Candidatus Nanoarchaeia archaeon]